MIHDNYPEARLRCLGGLSASLDIDTVYDLVRSWGCLRTIDRYTIDNGETTWEVAFIHEFDAERWERDWNGIRFQGQGM
jgi:hypothetical protein